jgi:hypothetical protein
VYAIENAVHFPDITQLCALNVKLIAYFIPGQEEESFTSETQKKLHLPDRFIVLVEVKINFRGQVQF